MSLSCSCGDDDVIWFYEPPDDFTLFDEKRRKRCCSCDDLINRGSLSLKFNRNRPAKNDIEERIHGDDVYLSPIWMCEACGDQYFNLTALGFCINLPANMLDLLKEYQENYGRKVA